MHKDIIETKRLVLRPVRSDDAEAIHSYAGDPSIDMMMFLPNETFEETKSFVEYAVSQWSMEKPEDREYVILLNGKIIGGINLEDCHNGNTYEIGWTIHADHRSHGYATEAAKALIGHAFSELKADHIRAHCDSRNAASEKVMKKVGMHLADDAGTRHYPKTGVTSGEYLYVIDKSKGF